MKSKQRNCNSKKCKKKSKRLKLKYFREGGEEGGGRSNVGILTELLILKGNILTLFVMAKNLVLKYYPDADVLNKNILIQGLIQMAENVQELICNIAKMTQSIICNDLIEHPTNVKDLVCKNARKFTDLTCSTMDDVLFMLNNFSKVPLSDKLINAVKGDSKIYLPSSK